MLLSIDFYVNMAYLVYLPITILITVWVANTLFKNGKVFLHDIFHGDTEMAESVNKLLLVGFYLVNIGYVVFTMQIQEHLESNREMLEFLSQKIGFIVLLLGGMHFFNLFIFFRLRKKAKQDQFQSKFGVDMHPVN